jgi:NAD(P)H dehydrogenase (quinone)
LTKKVLIVYHSEKRHTMFMAMNLEHRLEINGIDVDLKQIEKCDPVTMKDYDGIIIGSPTYFSNMSWQVKKFIDDSASIREDNFPLEGKIGGAFTSSWSRKDGEDCLKMIEVAMGLHHKMKIVPGIVVEDNDLEDNVARVCHEYGEQIAREIL